MSSIKSTFTAAASGRIGFSLFWLAVFAIAILDDEDRREQKHRDKRARFTKASAKPPFGPRPF